MTTFIVQITGTIVDFPATQTFGPFISRFRAEEFATKVIDRLYEAEDARLTDIGTRGRVDVIELARPSLKDAENAGWFDAFASDEEEATA